MICIMMHDHECIFKGFSIGLPAEGAGFTWALKDTGNVKDLVAAAHNAHWRFVKFVKANAAIAVAQVTLNALKNFVLVIYYFLLIIY